MLHLSQSIVRDVFEFVSVVDVLPVFWSRNFAQLQLLVSWEIGFLRWRRSLNLWNLFNFSFPAIQRSLISLNQQRAQLRIALLHRVESL
jgi:hypothetical protein